MTKHYASFELKASRYWENGHEVVCFVNGLPRHGWMQEANPWLFHIPPKTLRAFLGIPLMRKKCEPSRAIQPWERFRKGWSR